MTGKKIEIEIKTTADVVDALQQVVDNHEIDADVHVANGRNRRNTLTPFTVYARGTTGASEWKRKTGKRRGVIVVASQTLVQHSADEMDAGLVAAGIVLEIAESGDEERIKALGTRTKGGMPKGPKGITPLIADKGIRFASADEERGLESGRQVSNLRFANIGKMDAKNKALLDAVRAVYHGCTEVDDDGNELPFGTVNLQDAQEAADREAKRLANEALAAEYKAAGMVKVNGMWFSAANAKALAPMFKDGVDKDALTELKALQRGAIISRWAAAKVKAATVRATAKAEPVAQAAALEAAVA